MLNPATGWCEGCGRTLDEIARWAAMTPSEKWAVLCEIRARRNEQEPIDG